MRRQTEGDVRAAGCFVLSWTLDVREGKPDRELPGQVLEARVARGEVRGAGAVGSLDFTLQGSRNHRSVRRHS